MKRILIATLLAGIGILHAGEEKNLHPNPGAEKGTAGFGTYLASGKKRFTTTKEFLKSGTRSVFLQCVKDNTSTALMLCGSTGYIPRTAINVQAGQKYSFQFFIRSTKEMKNITYYALFWKKDLHNAKGRIYRGVKLYIDGKKTTKLILNDKWQEVMMDVSVPAGADKMDIAIQIKKGAAGETIFVDDVIITLN
jgi:hypothetical protein